MVDIKRGQTDKNASSDLLANFFKKNTQFDGKLYIGYPILYSGGENIILDALWISPKNGIVIFDLIEGIKFDDREHHRDALYNKLESELKQYEELTKRRNLLVDIEVLTYAPASKQEGFLKYTSFNDTDLLHEINSLPEWENSDDKIYRKTLSVIQSVIKIKAQIDRSYITKENSRGAVVKRLEETIANLDNQQEEAIIEYHDGLQRIRGLAGSGKTIVLAIKAAYLHATNPNWDIVVTFNTRSLKNQFKELIELFCIQKMGRKPNSDKIRIIQAWGGSRSTGVYYEFCKDYGIEYLDVRAAKAIATQQKIEPFDAVCRKALELVDKSKTVPTYDAILVDEAQDLSESFLNLCYLQLSKKKRLIYAYDELQKLNQGSSLRNPNKIFGRDASDIILKKCYRNSRPVLAAAHAFGFGIYHNKGLVQFFDQPALWADVGYIVKDGQLKASKNVTLTRAKEATHTFLEQEIDIEDIIQFKTFDSKQAQAIAIADDIQRNLKKEELLHRDIMIINPLALTTKKEVAMVRALLDSRGIRSHIAGDVDKDEFYRDKSVAFTGINRAKGNEVPFVYIMNGQDCYSHPFVPTRGLRERRNILFTAITRSKAWVRVFGIGENMKLLEEEFKLVKKNNFELSFTYPTQKEIERMNVISRDLTVTEEIQLKSDIDSLSNLSDIIQRVKSGENQLEDYPEEMQILLKALLD
ncbi:MAG: ATP-binding domain-containing protein [Bacteroidota bacterium]